MWFFDQILDDSKSSSTTASTWWAWNGSTWTWVSTDDSDILIIDDSSSIISETSLWDSNSIILDSAPIRDVSNITADDIPDTAISFFDNSSTEDILLQDNSQDLFISDEDVRDDSLSNESVILEDLEVSKNMNVWTTNIVDEEQNSIKTNTFFWVTEQEELINQEKADPNVILLDAIANLKKLLKWHEDIIEDKMHIVENKQSQIANLKQEIKSLTEEAKAIWEEKDKVVKMIELFESQKIK